MKNKCAESLLLDVCILTINSYQLVLQKTDSQISHSCDISLGGGRLCCIVSCEIYTGNQIINEMMMISMQISVTSAKSEKLKQELCVPGINNAIIQFCFPTNQKKANGFWQQCPNVAKKYSNYYTFRFLFFYALDFVSSYLFFFQHAFAEQRQVV